jgi:hypothetical protein
MTNKDKKKMSIILKPENAFGGSVRLIKIKTGIPNNKDEKEKTIARNFLNSNYCTDSNIINKEDIIDVISSNESNYFEDSHYKPDIILKTKDDRKIGLQLTELKLEHNPRTRTITPKIIKKFYDSFSEQISFKITNPIHINISSIYDYENTQLLLNNKEIRVLTSIIAEEIIAMVKYNKKSAVIKPISDKSLKTKITQINLLQLDKNINLYHPGWNNIYLQLNSDYVVINEDILEELINKIFENKYKSIADILLIWSMDTEFLAEEELIINLIKKKFMGSPKEIYFYNVLNNISKRVL